MRERRNAPGRAVDLRERVGGMERAVLAMEAAAQEGRRAAAGGASGRSGPGPEPLAGASGGRPGLAECADSLSDVARAVRCVRLFYLPRGYA